MQSKNSNKEIKYRFVKLLIIVLFSTFLVEASLIYGLSFFSFIQRDKELLIDLIVLILMLTPLFYTLLYVPIIKSIQKLHDKELRLKTKAHDTQILLNNVLMFTLQQKTLEEILLPILDNLLSFKWLEFEDKGAIFLIEDAPEMLKFKVGKNYEDAEFKSCSFEINKKCICENALIKSEIGDMNDVSKTLNIFKHQGHYCIPILNENILLGSIIIYFKNNVSINLDDENLLKSYAAIVAKTIMHYRNSEKIEKLNRNLVEKNKNLEQFAYITSHDLQEPLRTINSFVELIDKKNNTNSPQDFNQYFRYISQATNRMRSLISSLLEYSQLGRNFQFELVNVEILLNEVINDLNTTIVEHGVKIEISKLPTIYVNQIEIRQLFQNLIVNAIKFKKEDVLPIIKIEAKKEYDYWLFSVKDNGIGINEKYNDKIFQIFQRLHNRSKYEGLGVGLAFCKKIVELHDGIIWFKSEELNGSTFYFTIHDSLNKKINNKTEL